MKFNSQQIPRVFLTIFFLFFFSKSFLFSFQYHLSICAIFQDEAPYIKEWVDYHISKGVEHFWLYNNNSSDGYKEELNSYIYSGIVELFEWPSKNYENDFYHFSFEIQAGAYNDALSRARNVSKWLAIIDVDEFIVPVCNPKIIDILEIYYSNASGLCVNWQCYGTSHVSRCKKGEMLSSLVYKLRWDHPKNKFYKSIVQPLHVYYNNNPHFCVYLSGHWHINSNYVEIKQETDEIVIDRIRINHYWTKDEWFLHNVKIPRYQRWGTDPSDILQSVEEMNEVYDPIN